MSDYTRNAVAALAEAVEVQQDFPGWLADVLARVAARQQEGSRALSAGRPGSWEAALVGQLLAGTVGHDDAFLSHYKHEEPPVRNTVTLDLADADARFAVTDALGEWAWRQRGEAEQEMRDDPADTTAGRRLRWAAAAETALARIEEAL